MFECNNKYRETLSYLVTKWVITTFWDDVIANTERVINDATNTTTNYLGFQAIQSIARQGKCVDNVVSPTPNLHGKLAPA